MMLQQRVQQRKTLRMNKLMAYVALELAKSINHVNRLADYCMKSYLLGNTFFKKLIRDMLLRIRSTMRIYVRYEPYIAVQNPLWHS